MATGRMQNLESTSQIRSTAPSIKVMVLTPRTSEDLLLLKLIFSAIYADPKFSEQPGRPQECTFVPRLRLECMYRHLLFYPASLPDANDRIQRPTGGKEFSYVLFSSSRQGLLIRFET